MPSCSTEASRRVLRLRRERQGHCSGNPRYARRRPGSKPSRPPATRPNKPASISPEASAVASPGTFQSGDDALTNMMTTLDPRSRAATRGWSDITIRNVFVIPTVAFLIIFNVFPLLYSLGFSFTDFRASSKDAGQFRRPQELRRRSGRSGHLAHLLDDAVVRDRLGHRPVRRRLRPGAAAQPPDPVQGPADHAADAADDAVAGGRGTVLEADLRSVLGHPQLRARPGQGGLADRLQLWRSTPSPSPTSGCGRPS